jgi:peptidoglycan/LPS O-acetylase OafA/YrhL
MKKLPNLNPLRFILASLVILFHVPQLSRNQGLPYFDSLPVFHKGTEAVYMFFILSGFLIIRIIYIELNQGTFSIFNFYMRRILRILPLYYLIVIFGFTFYKVILPLFDIPFDTHYNIKDGILLSILFLPNIFATYSPGGILEILWSIGIEEQFYLLVAPLFLILKKRKIITALSFLFTGYFILFHYSNIGFLMENNFVYYFLFAGGIVGVLAEKNKLNFFNRSKLLAYAIIAITIIFFTTDVLKFNNQIIYHCIICIIFSLFIYVISMTNGIYKIQNKYLDYLGKISYGMYMYHAIALNGTVFLFIKINEKITLPTTSVIIGIYSVTFLLTILLSHTSYKYYESYFLKQKEKYRR